MYLKALEIQGFKSFPDRTKLTFEKDITAIVGPNGSGKSNISDAILWVMGEQSSKTLRGQKMEDVIFGGTALRNPMGYAEVSLLIDNSERIFDSDSSEVELTRRYYRSGESEYYINRESVRLKDINSLLMDTGLGRDGYSIIGQGKIADIISTKSTDRREVFDEAAGISRYRYRKEEAERRLARTDENLLRINDKIEELELQVGPLKEQSEIAKKYLILRDELRGKEVSAWMETLDRIHEKADAVVLEFEQSKTALDRARADLDALYASADSLTERMHRKDEESETAREKLRAKESEAAECAGSIEVLKANAANSEEAMNRLIADIAEQESRSDEIRAGIEENENRLSEIASLKKELDEKAAENSNVLTGCRMKINSREEELSKLTDGFNSLTADIRYTGSRISLLEGMEREYEGYSKAVKTVMREAGRGTLKGIHGPVANIVRTDDDLALAIETALGASGQHIVVETRENGRSAIEMLKRTDSGRGTFLPLDTIRGEVLDRCPEDEDGYIGVAYDLVRFEDRYDEIVASILGKTIIVETLADAIRISRNNRDKYRLVTLDGQVVNAGGSMTGGSAARGSGLLSRANELEQLKKKSEELAAKEKELKARLEKARQELSAERYNLDMALEDRNAISSEQSSLGAEETAVKNTVYQFNLLLDSITGDSGARHDALEKARGDIENIRKEIEKKSEKLGAINEGIEAVKAEIAEIVSKRMELEGRRTQTDADTKRRFEEINELERRTARIEQKKLSSEMEEKQILDRLWDNYELSHSAAQQLRRPVESLTKANKEIAELKKEIGKLGTPNIGAIDEYERVSSRYGFLTEQRDDVETAKRELLGIIREVTKEMKEVFTVQFKLIDSEFKKTFTELFGGGKASLILEDETDVLNCGIEINVQPPGKAVTSISLLSGGEKAFVAIALYFAILRVRPTPFCVMDEIEAALDEANVSRFSEYLRSMAKRTQFLVITHRRGTMEEADMLYGVTMQEKGVSTILELNLEEARKSAED